MAIVVNGVEIHVIAIDFIHCYYSSHLLDRNILNLQGKTTSVHALARELLGSYYKDAVLELNASDARGIDVRFVVGYSTCNFFFSRILTYLKRA